MKIVQHTVPDEDKEKAKSSGPQPAYYGGRDGGECW